MILEKNGERGLVTLDTSVYRGLAVQVPTHRCNAKSPRLRKGHVSTAAVFSEYKSCEWLIRETYKKAGCLRIGCKVTPIL